MFLLYEKGEKMDKDDIEKIIDGLPSNIAKSITMKQTYFDKLTNSTYFCIKE